MQVVCAVRDDRSLGRARRQELGVHCKKRALPWPWRIPMTTRNHSNEAYRSFSDGEHWDITRDRMAELQRNPADPEFFRVLQHLEAFAVAWLRRNFTRLSPTDIE